MAALGLALASACSESGSRGSVPGDLEIPPRLAEFDDGSPDSCEILKAFTPQKIFKAPMGPAKRMYGLCLVDITGWDGSPPEHSVGLEIRKADERGVPTDLESFWQSEGTGVGFMGGERAGIQEIEDVADYSVWAPIDDGLRLYAYWKGEYILLLTIIGAPADYEAVLPWAKDVARAAVAASEESSQVSQGSGAEPSDGTPPVAPAGSPGEGVADAAQDDPA